MRTPPAWPVALTIAGSDSSGGAGVQADLKTFAAHEVYGASAVAAVTAQNTRTIVAGCVLTPDLVVAQMEAVLVDLPVVATKTGMLGSAAIVEAITPLLMTRRSGPLVVDPVIRSTSGHGLLDDAGVSALRKHLLPLADLITPNREEATALCGRATSAGEVREQARCLIDLGARAVLITGGDAQDDMVMDLFHDGHDFHEIRRPRVRTTSTHGTGCTLSAAVTARLARGESLFDAIEAARDYLQLCLEGARPLGGGAGPLHHFHGMWRAS